MSLSNNKSKNVRLDSHLPHASFCESTDDFHAQYTCDIQRMNADYFSNVNNYPREFSAIRPIHNHTDNESVTVRNRGLSSQSDGHSHDQSFLLYLVLVHTLYVANIPS